MRLVTKYETNM